MVAVGTIQRITKTMQMIATAKFTAAVQRTRATQPYTEKIRELVAAVCRDPSELDHPLVAAENKNGKDLLLVIGSDRGFCGAYNSNVLRKSLRYYKEQVAAGRDVVVETSGKKAQNFFRFAKVDVAATHDVGDKPAYEVVAEIADSLMDRFISGELASVKIAYMRFESNSRQIPEIQPLLPMEAPTGGDESEAGGSSTMYEFTPDEETLLNDLLPRAVRTSLFQAYNDSVVSEQIMRMIAMKAATDNAAGLGRNLKRDYNRARQARITTELTEIVSGAAALA